MGIHNRCIPHFLRMVGLAFYLPVTRRGPDRLPGRAGHERLAAHRLYFLIASLVGNLGSLSIFKYSGFIAENISQLLTWIGYPCDLKAQLPGFTLILPVGISFFTFQSMSYAIDVYRGHMKPVTNLFHFFAFLSMFPQLIAGPIVRAKDLIPSSRKSRNTSEAERWEGLKLIARGYFRKW